MPATKIPDKVAGEGTQPFLSKKNFKDIAFVTITKLVTLLASLLSGFIVPAMLDVGDYGYIKVAELWVAYVGVLGFGFFDGVFLLYSGKDIKELPSDKFRVFMRIEIGMDLFWAVVVSIASIFVADSNYRVILLFVGLDIFLGVLSSHFILMSQIVSKFSFESIVSLVSTAVKAVIVGIFAILFYTKTIETVPWDIYLFCSLIPTVVEVICFVVFFKKLIFGKAARWSETKAEVAQCFLKGLPLMVSNFVIIFILACDKQFVQMYYSIETYGVYAFAYSMLSIISTTMLSASQILFPTLKQKGTKTSLDHYEILVSTILILMSICSFAYYPADLIVVWALPKYVDSLPIFRLIIGAFCAYGVVAMVNHNFYKMELKNTLFLVFSCIALVLSVGLNYLGYYTIGTTYGISLMTVFALLFWYFLTSIPLIHKAPGNRFKNSLFLLLFIGSFIGTSFLPFLWLDFLVNFLIVSLLNVVFFHKEYRQFWLVLSSKNKERKLSLDLQNANGQVSTDVVSSGYENDDPSESSSTGGPNQKKNGKERNLWIDLCRLLMAIFVVGIHTSLAVGWSGPNMPEALLKATIFRTAVPFFFLCTAYFTYDKFKRSGNDPRVFFKASLRYLILYLFWTLLYLPFKIYSIYQNEGTVAWEFWKWFLQNFFFLSPMTPLWYVRACCVGLFIFGLLLKCKVKPEILLPLALLLYIVGAFGSTYMNFLPPAIFDFVILYNSVFLTTTNFVFFGFFFMDVGLCIYRFLENNTILKGGQISLVITLAFSIACLFAESYLLYTYGGAGDSSSFMALVVADPVLFLLLISIKKQPHLRIGNFLGDLSSLLYFLHMYILEIYLKVSAGTNYYGFFPVEFFAVLLISLLLSLIVALLSKTSVFKFLRIFF
jgi:O-antigen/teichoic acid export membrane protein